MSSPPQPHYLGLILSRSGIFLLANIFIRSITSTEWVNNITCPFCTRIEFCNYECDTGITTFGKFTFEDCNSGNGFATQEQRQRKSRGCWKWHVELGSHKKTTLRKELSTGSRGYEGRNEGRRGRGRKWGESYECSHAKCCQILLLERTNKCLPGVFPTGQAEQMEAEWSEDGGLTNCRTQSVSSCHVVLCSWTGTDLYTHKGAPSTTEFIIAHDPKHSLFTTGFCVQFR